MTLGGAYTFWDHHFIGRLILFLGHANMGEGGGRGNVGPRSGYYGGGPQHFGNHLRGFGGLNAFHLQLCGRCIRYLQSNNCYCFVVHLVLTSLFPTAFFFWKGKYPRPNHMGFQKYLEWWTKTDQFPGHGTTGVGKSPDVHRGGAYDMGSERTWSFSLPAKVAVGAGCKKKINIPPST